MIDPFNNRIYEFNDIFDVDNMVFDLYYSLKTADSTINAAGNLLEANIENTNNRDILNKNNNEINNNKFYEINELSSEENSDEIIYGEGGETPNIVWFYNGNNLDKNSPETIETTNANGSIFSIGLYFSNIPSGVDLPNCIDFTYSNDEIIT
jgi:hypothetical protein